MNNIIKQEITVVQNKEGAIFQIGDTIVKTVTNKTRSDHFLTPSKILHFIVNKNGTIKAVTDFKIANDKIIEEGIVIDKIELVKQPKFPRCFKIRSLGSTILNRLFIEKINKLIRGLGHFAGNSTASGFYCLNLDNLNERGCTDYPSPKFQEVTVEQFLKYCEDEKI
jgi:hypothetical protein